MPVARFSRTKRMAQVVVKMKDKVGALADINRITAGQGVDFRQSLTFSVSGTDYAVYNPFVWLTKENYHVDELVKELKESPFVLDVQAKEGVNGSVVDTLTFPIQFSSERVLLLEAKALIQMFEATESVFGTGGTVIIYQLGKSYGNAMAAELTKALTKEYLVLNYGYGIWLMAATGWGIPKIVRANEDLTSVVVRIDESFECADRKTKEPHGRFMGGYLAGVFSFLSGENLNVKETKCLAVGDGQSEFVLSKADMADIKVDIDVVIAAEQGPAQGCPAIGCLLNMKYNIMQLLE